MTILDDCKKVSPVDDIDIMKVTVHILNSKVYKVYPLKLML